MRICDYFSKKETKNCRLGLRARWHHPIPKPMPIMRSPAQKNPKLTKFFWSKLQHFPHL